jgi:cytochrome c oxidase subunit 1
LHLILLKTLFLKDFFLWVYNRFFCASSHKDIGSLYFYLGVVGGIIGTGARWLIRIQLGKPVKLFSSGHLYNVILTFHALAIIFFLVMPVLMGGFGN